MKQTPVVFLLGATATGKSDLALRLAQRFNAEIVSIDSALIYRDMDIGTAKPSAAMREQVPHHLIDIVAPTQRYDAGRFRTDALAAIEQIHSRGRVPLFVGGTMMYYKALTQGLHDLPRADAALRERLEARAALEGWPALHAELARLDPASAQRLQPTDAQRIQRALEVFHVTGKPWSAVLAQGGAEPLPYRSVVCALVPADRAALHARIAQRFDQMLAAGLIEELRQPPLRSACGATFDALRRLSASLAVSRRRVRSRILAREGRGSDTPTRQAAVDLAALATRSNAV
jgi:tRNA dimethylallyltransferase